MKLSIWQACAGEQYISDFHVLAYRVVDSHQVAMASLVDNPAEHDVLEELLVRNRPNPLPMPAALDALLATPFREPRLHYASRFGDKQHRGIFYASLKVSTALAECAYYRFVFLHGMATPLPNPVQNHYHSFAVSVSTHAGVQLDEQPFAPFEASISHPSHYQVAQALGADMRAANVTAFSYVSARAADRGLNIGVFDPDAISSRTPKMLADWACYTDAGSVKFTRPFQQSGAAMSYHFARDDFLVDGEWPIAAL